MLSKNDKKLSYLQATEWVPKKALNGKSLKYYKLTTRRVVASQECWVFSDSKIEQPILVII